MGGRSPLEVHVSAPSPESAKRLADVLIEERLAGYVRVIGPMFGVFRWREEVEATHEYLVIAKTFDDAFDRLAERVAAEHPYDVPEVVAVPIARVAESYAGWLAAQVPAPPELSVAEADPACEATAHRGGTGA